MKKTAPLALILALAAGTSRPAASVASLQELESAPLAPMAVVLQDEAQERATLGLEDRSRRLGTRRRRETAACGSARGALARSEVPDLAVL